MAITNKEEYLNVKAQIERQKAEIVRTRKQMDDLEVLVNELEQEVLAVAELYEEKPEEQPVEETPEEQEEEGGEEG
jgi:hypothetical protein